MAFKVGDFVRLRYGHTKMRVVDISGALTYARYCGTCPDEDYENQRNGGYDTARTVHHFKPWDLQDPQCSVDNSINEDTPIEKDIAMGKPKANQLFQTNEKKPRYGTFLTTNNSGQFVLEMKGESGKVQAFDKSSLEKVVPYTFRTTSQYQGTAISTHFAGTKGAVKVADILVSKCGTLHYVAEIDTGYENPAKPFTGSKITAKPLK